MNILSKIKYIAIFIAFSTIITLSAFSGEFDTTLPGAHIMPIEQDYEFAEEEYKEFARMNPKGGILLPYTNSDDETDKHTSPRSIGHSQSMFSRLTIDQSERKDMKISENANAVNYYPSNFSLNNETKPAKEEIPTPSPLTIEFHSTHTCIHYILDDFIRKTIGEYIKILVKNGRLKREDKARYNYDFSIVCNPELSKDVLTDLGVDSLTRKTIITKDVEAQLKMHRCILSFCFREQTVLSSKHERTNRLLYHQEEPYIRELRINDFIRRARNPSKATSQSALHLGYVFRDGRIVSEFPQNQIPSTGNSNNS